MGPYETERDTLREPMPREVRAAQTAGAEQHDVPGLRLIGAGADIVLRHLADACNAAGVEIADYDRRILAWLSRWEPSTAQVVIGLIARAYEAGIADRARLAQPDSFDAFRNWLRDELRDAGCEIRTLSPEGMAEVTVRRFAEEGWRVLQPTAAEGGTP